MEIKRKSNQVTATHKWDRISICFISFQEIKSIFLFTKSLWGHEPKSNLDIPDENHTKGLWQEVKTELYNMDQLVTYCCQFDFSKYHLSTMKLNLQTKKNTQTIKDGSTPLKQASEWFGSVFNLVVYNRTLLSKRELGFEWTQEWMKTKTISWKKEIKPCYCFLLLFSPCFFFSFSFYAFQISWSSSSTLFS